MSNIKKFLNRISLENLSNTYLNKIYYTTAIGVDNISSYAFNIKHKEEIEIIHKKVKNKTYKFSRYKLKLISKGKGKPPRDLYIPTIRDRLLLKTINDFLLEIYDGEIIQKLPQIVIRELKDTINQEQFDTYIKIDIQSFYPTIDQDILIKTIKRKVRSEVFIRLLKQAINPSYSKQWDNIQGVPQGLSISNTLAHIYLIDIDNYFLKNNNIQYFRFVDDILILCKNSDTKKIIGDLTTLFNKKNLNIYPPQPKDSKSKIGSIRSDPFDYLGYSFKFKNISVRDSSVNNLRNGLVEIFTAYRYARKKNIDFLRWRLNLKITGCIQDHKSKGWLFFYSQITDLSLVYELDHFIQVLAVKFNLAEILKSVKKFSKAYFEINHNLKSTTYIPNFDNANRSEKIEILTDYFNINCKSLNDDQIDYEFQKKIRKQVNKLLTDPRDFS